MTKLAVLEATLYNLKNNVYDYDWANCDSCNCGILARTIMNGALPKSEGGLFNLTHKVIDLDTSGFSGLVKSTINYCRTTNTPFPRIIKALLDYDFTIHELVGLEHFGSAFGCTSVDYSNIVGNLDVKLMQKENKFDVIEYLEAWIAEIKRKEQEQVIEEVKEEELVCSM